MKPSVFIGSSGYGKRTATALKVAMTSTEDICDIKLWNQGVFGLSLTTIESLEAELDSADFAIFIITPDDTILKKDESKVVPRDNVVFELGLFSGRLGRERVFVLYEKSPDESAPRIDMPSDWHGVTEERYTKKEDYDELRQELATASYNILSAIKRVQGKSNHSEALLKSSENYVRTIAPDFTAALDRTVFTLVERTLAQIAKEEYYQEYSLKIIICPDSAGEEFRVERSSSYSLYTPNNVFGRKVISWYRSIANRDSIEYDKFEIDGEDRLEEWNNSREFLERNARDNVMPYGTRREPIPYNKTTKEHKIVSESRRTVLSTTGVISSSTIFGYLAKNVTITIQLDGPHAHMYELVTFSYSAFSHQKSEYSSEYKLNRTTKQNTTIMLSGWLLPGWGYNYYVIKRT